MTIYVTGKELIQRILSLCNGLNTRFIRTGIAQGVTFVKFMKKFIFLYKTYKN